jgi:hypothetical protein
MAVDLKALANALSGAVNSPVNYGANINDTATTAPVNANIRNLGSLEGQGDAAARAISALGTGATAQASSEEASQRAAAQKSDDEAQAAKDELDYLNDPRNYRAVINKVGGYDFYNPMGGKISPVEYAKVTNQHLTDVYKKSEDPKDKEFVEDYKQLFDLGKAMQSGDKTALDKLFKKDPSLEKAMRNKKLSYGDVVKQFRSYYPGYFGEKQFDSYGNNRTLPNSGQDIGSRVKKLLSGLFD